MSVLLDDIESKIKSKFQDLRDVINQNESIIINQLIEYKQGLQSIKTNNTDQSKIIDTLCNGLFELINSEKKYYKQQLIVCENIIKRHGSNDDYNYPNDNSDRQQGLEKLSNNTQNHYKQKQSLIVMLQIWHIIFCSLQILVLEYRLAIYGHSPSECC